jgi:multidrug efflux pump subunit AcrB
MLIGLVTKNGILIVEFANQLESKVNLNWSHSGSFS